MNAEQMQAGRELDELIAQRVMGESRPAMQSGEAALLAQLAGSPIRSAGGQWVEFASYLNGDEPVWYPRPFSTDIAAAWTVVEKLRERGTVDIVDWRNLPRDDYGDKAWLVEIEFDDELGTFYGRADTASLAICRAALAAIGNGESGGAE